MSLPRSGVAVCLLLAAALALLLAHAIPAISGSTLRLDSAIATPSNETRP